MLGIIGTGSQARHQVSALVAVRPIRLVKVLGRDPIKAQEFARWVSASFDVEAVAVSGPQEVVAGSSLVVIATTASEPLFAGEWLEPGTHVSGVGANTPKKQELDPAAFRHSKIVVMHAIRCWKRLVMFKRPFAVARSAARTSLPSWVQ